MLLLTSVLSCKSSPSSPEVGNSPTLPSDTSSGALSVWQQLGDSLTLERQRQILQKVLTVAQKEGWAGAVRYCHSAAETLTFYRTAEFSLQRVALRYRNPKNALADSLDRRAYTYYDTTRAQHSVVWVAGPHTLRYYRPIYLAMPQCLKCHGKPEDLDGPALAEIRRRYPGDKARDFALGDLRGLWKVEFRLSASP